MTRQIDISTGLLAKSGKRNILLKVQNQHDLYYEKGFRALLSGTNRQRWFAS